MARKKSARTIKVSQEKKEMLKKLFNCTERMVYKALCFESETSLARRIQYVAQKEMGGWIEATAPEDEIFYDTKEDGERFMVHYFSNGAVLRVSLDTGIGVVMFKGETVKRYERVYVDEIPAIQDYARNLR